ncbi:zinc-dependent metalloprotease, partial [Pedobacter sp.]|uniref:zinc-dependent metalloprotease n=1 Tax=Pedobacter sp. TaxID=1411316 RepID=UPI002C059FD7
LRDKAFVEANGHTPSIMDYARFNYVAQPEDKISPKGIYPRIGDYDKWAIEWGYKLLPEAKSPAAEVPVLNKISVERLKNKRLWFGTEMNPDDPRSQNEDLGDNAMIASTYGIKNLKVILAKLPEWTRSANEGYDDLENMYGQLTGQFSRYMGHVAKNIGGIYETPKTVEQAGTVYERTPAAMQKEALVFLDQNLFRTPSWLLSPEILNNTGADPVELINRLQAPVLGRLLSSATLSKLISAEAADGASAYKITDLFTDLQGSVFTELKTNGNIDVYRRNLQKAYVENLIAVLKPAPASAPSGPLSMGGMDRRMSPSRNDVVSVVKAQLRSLNSAIKSATAQASGLSKYHLQDLSERIDTALDPKS